VGKYLQGVSPVRGIFLGGISDGGNISRCVFGEGISPGGVSSGGVSFSGGVSYIQHVTGPRYSRRSIVFDGRCFTFECLYPLSIIPWEKAAANILFVFC